MPTSKCNEFEEQVQAAIEARAALDLSAPEWAGWAEHVRRCAGCSRQWSEALTLQAALSAWTSRLTDADRVDVHFADAVMARWNAESAAPVSAATDRPQFMPLTDVSRSSDSSRKVATTLLVALVLCVVAAVGFLLPPRLSPQVARNGNQGPSHGVTTPREKVTDDGATKAPVAAAENSGTPTNGAGGEVEDVAKDDDTELAGLLRNAGTASLSLAGEAAGVMREAASLLSVTRTNQEPMVDVPSDPPATDLPTRGLIPWGQKLESAVDFLWDALPLEESPAI
ncbi:MAG: hypothetical protein IT428_25820 [Planctomycetaceae bacterium]|nr:hypothetical protein [Planctomycetaceae bacterium]